MSFYQLMKKNNAITSVSLDGKITSRKTFLMKTNIKLILLILFLQCICFAGFAQTNIDPCGGGDPLPPVEIPPQPAPIPVDSAQVPVLNPVDPNEIIGLDGYDAAGSVDTFHWVLAMQTLVYAVCFDKDAALTAVVGKAMFTPSKVFNLTSLSMPIQS